MESLGGGVGRMRDAYRTLVEKSDGRKVGKDGRIM